MAAKDEVQGNTLDQVRDILFGEQQRKSEQRFSKFESVVRRDIEKLRAELEKRLEALKSDLAKRTDELSAYLDDESAERSDVEKAIEKDVAARTKALEGRIGQGAKEAAAATREARAQATKDAKTLRSELEERIGELERWAEESFESIRESHVSKEELSAFFADFALRLVDKKQIRRE